MRAKDVYYMGEIQKQFNVEDNVRIGGVSVSPTTKLHSKWSKLYQSVAVKGDFATVEDPEREEPLTIHVARLAFSRTHLIAELAPEPFLPFDVPFRSNSNSSMPELFGECPVEQPT